MDSESDIVKVMARLYGRGLNVSQSGNASIMHSSGMVAITPAALDKPTLKPELVCYLKLPSGQLMQGPKQSSEYMMHIQIYDTVKHTTAVVHAHPPYLLALVETLGIDKLGLEDDEEGKGYVKKISIVKGHTGTKELAESVASALETEKTTTVIMKGHGITSISTGREGIYDALNRIEVIEHLAMRRVLAYTLGK